METITHTEFNRNPSEAAKTALRDGIVVITHHGVPALDLVPHQAGMDPRDRSVVAGETIPATSMRLDVTMFDPVLKPGTDIDALLREVSGDHDY